MNQGGKERTWEPLGTPIANGAERVEQTRALFIVRFLVAAFSLASLAAMGPWLEVLSSYGPC